MAAVSCGKDDPAPTPDPTPKAPTAISLSASALTAAQAGQTLSLDVTAPFVPKLSGAPSWISVSQGAFSDYKVTLTLVVSANETYEERSATVTVTSGTKLSATFSVSQGAAEKPDDPTPGEITQTLVTKNPTDRVQALYQYICGLYGNKIISSVMADVNWNHKIADNIGKSTGKYPAMNCYDFIHIYVPKNNWIDYSNLTPVTEWADAGGIVSLMWHFNVPKTASTTIGTDGSGVTCTPSETSFRAKNIFTSASWENKWFYEQMDKVIEVLLALQEKGIPAIWRPFHEAAGNATLKQQASWATAWFWWGYDGAEVYKKVWKAMFEYFEQKGVRNLIWVWTTQNFNGNASQYNQDKDWYPGDAYVDIVARDLYGYNSTQNVTEFSEIQKAYPTKMVTLGECGKSVPSEGDPIDYARIPELWSAGAKWSWFMPWYGGSLPDDAWWKDAMGSAAVINRSQVKF